jgi:putative transposase
MARPKTTEVRRTLKRLLPDGIIRQLARETGAVQRDRHIDIVALVWTLVLGFCTGRTRSFAGLRRSYEQATGTTVVPSSFYDRFNKRLARLLRVLLDRAIAQTSQRSPAMNGILAPFRDLMAIDSTVIRLHDALKRAFKACRTNHTLAALKAHVVINVQGMGPSRVKITAERCHDGPILRAGAWVRGRLLLFDLGYWRFQLFDNIDRQGGFFITRLKAGANPLIIAAHQRWRGRAVQLVGERLRNVFERLRRSVLDVEVELGFQRRVYRGKRRRGRYRCRLVAVLDRETGCYHAYLTNIPPDMLSAEEIAYTYRARWVVELMFKELKQHYRIDQLPSRKRVVVEALIYAALLTIIVSRALRDHVRSRLCASVKDRVPTDRWASLFSTLSQAILSIVVRPPRHTVLDRRHLDLVIAREARDPNRSRLLLLEPLVEGAPR